VIDILTGDVRERLRELPDASVHCCVTSPPYFGLRDYGMAGQLGLEPTPDAFVAELVAVFRDVRRVLREDGTLWLNLGDSYGTGSRGQNFDPASGATNKGGQGAAGKFGHRKQPPVRGMHKQLLGIPWRVAFALQADGWWLRQDIIWSKPNPMPESVTDRCTKAHEYLFLLSKSDRYYFDAKAIAEPVAASTIARLSQSTLDQQQGSDRVPGKTNGRMKAKPPRFGGHKYGDNDDEQHRTKSGNDYEVATSELRNRRSVWTVTSKPFKEAHFATFPPDLIEPCILAGAPVGGTVLDPFFGAGTTGLVAVKHERNCVGIELNPAYVDIARRRLNIPDLSEFNL
jgi:DNA modification methylase